MNCDAARLTCMNLSKKPRMSHNAKSSMFMRVQRTVPQFTFILSKRFVNHNSSVSTGFLRVSPVLSDFGHTHAEIPSKLAQFYFFNAFVSCPFCRSIA
jgi:hypothetical protein